MQRKKRQKEGTINPRKGKQKERETGAGRNLKKMETLRRIKGRSFLAGKLEGLIFGFI